MDQAERQQLVRRAQEFIVEDSPSLILFHRDIIHAYNKRRFKGMKPILGNGIGFPYMPLSYMDIEALTPRKVMRLTTIYDIASLNPFQTPEIYNSTTLRLIYATFVTRDEKAEVMPWALLVEHGRQDHGRHRPAAEHQVPRRPARHRRGREVHLRLHPKHKFPAMGRVTDAVESARSPATTRCA